MALSEDSVPFRIDSREAGGTECSEIAERTSRFRGLVSGDE
jgi:hypothetical protein